MLATIIWKSLSPYPPLKDNKVTTIYETIIWSIRFEYDIYTLRKKTCIQRNHIQGVLSSLVRFLLPTRCRCRRLLLHLATLNDTYIFGRILLHEGSARHRNLYLTRHNIQKRQTAIHPAGSETRNPSKRANGDLHVLQRGHWNRQEQGGGEDKKGLEGNV
jgi:hypothetical protein